MTENGEDAQPITTEQIDAEQARERKGDCDNCGGRGSVFQLPTGHDFCMDCTQVYISWETDGGRAEDPEMFAWLWKDGTDE